MRSTEEYFEAFLASGLATMNDLDLQSLQVARKHPPFGVVQSRQILGTRFPKDTSGERDEVAALVHGADCGIAIEVEFSFQSARWRGGRPIPGRMD